MTTSSPITSSSLDTLRRNINACVITDDTFSVLEIKVAKAGRTLGFIVEIEDGKGGFSLFVRRPSENDEDWGVRITRYVNDFIEVVGC